jgi:hypothetical protein
MHAWTNDGYLVQATLSPSLGYFSRDSQTCCKGPDERTVLVSHCVSHMVE